MARPAKPAPKIINAVRTLMDRTSVCEAARLLDIAEATAARIAAGLPVTTGTAAHAERTLVALGELDKDAA